MAWVFMCIVSYSGSIHKTMSRKPTEVKHKRSHISDADMLLDLPVDCLELLELVTPHNFLTKRYNWFGQSLFPGFSYSVYLVSLEPDILHILL